MLPDAIKPEHIRKYLDKSGLGSKTQANKTHVTQIKDWSTRLDAAIQLAKTLPLNPGMSSIYVLHQQSGSGYTRDGFNSRWRKAIELAIATFPNIDFNFTFHDLKAKGVSRSGR